MKAGAETHLPRLMTPRGIPVGVLKAGSSFSPSSNTLLLNTWKEKNKKATWLFDTYNQSSRSLSFLPLGVQSQTFRMNKHPESQRILL